MLLAAPKALAQKVASFQSQAQFLVHRGRVGLKTEAPKRGEKSKGRGFSPAPRSLFRHLARPRTRGIFHQQLSIVNSTQGEPSHQGGVFLVLSPRRTQGAPQAVQSTP